MANITEEKWIEMLEKKADGTYIAKYPKVKSKSGITFDEHLADKANPHQVDKEQVGLGNVQNYGIATESEALGGTVDNKYMTPLKTKKLVDYAINETKEEISKEIEVSIGSKSGIIINDDYTYSVAYCKSPNSYTYYICKTGEVRLRVGAKCENNSYPGSIKVYKNDSLIKTITPTSKDSYTYTTFDKSISNGDVIKIKVDNGENSYGDKFEAYATLEFLIDRYDIIAFFKTVFN